MEAYAVDKKESIAIIQTIANELAKARTKPVDKKKRGGEVVCINHTMTDTCYSGGYDVPIVIPFRHKITIAEPENFHGFVSSDEIEIFDCGIENDEIYMEAQCTGTSAECDTCDLTFKYVDGVWQDDEGFILDFSAYLD